MKDSYDGTFGVLVTYSDDVSIPILCSGPDGGARTPNLTMIRQYIGNDGAITSCTFGKRRIYPDEMSRQTNERIQGSPNKEQHAAHSKSSSGSDDQSSLNLKDNERRLIIQALKQSNGDTAQAAKTLGISEKALRQKIKDDDITQ